MMEAMVALVLADHLLQQARLLDRAACAALHRPASAERHLAATTLPAVLSQLQHVQRLLESALTV